MLEGQPFRHLKLPSHRVVDSPTMGDLILCPPVDGKQDPPERPLEQDMNEPLVLQTPDCGCGHCTCNPCRCTANVQAQPESCACGPQCRCESADSRCPCE